MKEIPLSRGLFALVDDEDFDRVNQFKWHALGSRGSYYAARKVPMTSSYRKMEYLHVVVFGAKRVDHRNGNRLDCRNENLRKATVRQNSQAFRQKPKGTTSKFRGVWLEAGENRWRAGIKANGKRIRLGHFESEELAARAYDKAAREHFGEFAAPNFP